ncbi:MAG: carboxypeptidase M32, partial [Candidatus Hodarchaeota archaeon]
GYASSLLLWDQQTKMPTEGAGGRAEIFAAVKAEWFKLFTSHEIGKILEKLAGRETELEPGEQVLIRRIRNIYERAKAIPQDLFKAFNEAKARAYDVWVDAKEKSNFTHFQPALEEIIGFIRQFAEHYGYDKNPYDALLPDYEPGITSEELKRIIKSLRENLIPFVKLLTEQSDQPDETLLRGHFPEDLQKQLSLEALRVIGYDFNQGRLDKTNHPFTISIGPDDARVTTHFTSGKLAAALFGTLHEGGHGLYDQGIDPLLKWVYLDNGYSMGIHESQSLMFENLVGRGLPFWKFFYPRLQRIFPYYESIPLENFYRAINIVKPSPIRIYADEVTYSLHIMFRFEIEEALIKGEIEVKDLPELWNAKMQEYLGILPENDAKGLLQDVHWSSGHFGYFPSYMLGHLYSAQLFAAAKREINDLQEEIAKGNLKTLLTWLRGKVHPFGLVREAPELLREVTGEGPNPQHWLEYIKEKFSQIYRIS